MSHTKYTVDLKTSKRWYKRYFYPIPKYRLTNFEFGIIINNKLAIVSDDPKLNVFTVDIDGSLPNHDEILDTIENVIIKS